MKQVKIICNIFWYPYLETFNNHIIEVEDGREKHVLMEEDVEAALEKVKNFRNNRHTCRHQVWYMRYQLYFTTASFETFFHGLKLLNNLKHFHVPP